MSLDPEFQIGTEEIAKWCISKSYKDTNQSSVNDISTEIENSNDVSTETLNSNDTPDAPSSDITDNTLNSNDTHEQIISHNEESNTSNLDIYQEEAKPRDYVSSVTPTSLAETISLEEKVENEFLDSKHRETARKEIIENIKTKKFQDQELLSTPENTIPKISISPNKNVSIPK